MTKTIDHCFAGSINAKKLGFYTTGCWYVSVGGKIKMAFASANDAATYADSLPEPWQVIMGFEPKNSNEFFEKFFPMSLKKSVDNGDLFSKLAP